MVAAAGEAAAAVVEPWHVDDERSQEVGVA